MYQTYLTLKHRAVDKATKHFHRLETSLTRHTKKSATISDWCWQGSVAGVRIPTSCCQFWVFWVSWPASQESVRSEPETPHTLAAHDAWVPAPVHVLETTHLTWGGTSPTAWRWRSRAWGSLLSSPFLLVITGKYNASLTQNTNILHCSASWDVIESTGSPVLHMEALVWPQGKPSSASTRRCSIWLHSQELHGISTEHRQTHSFSPGYV